MRILNNRFSRKSIVLGFLIATIALPSGAQELTYKELIQSGIKLYRLKEFTKSAEQFRAAANVAQPNSMDQLAALDNLLLPISELHLNKELWEVRRQAAVLRQLIQGTPIPEDLNGTTQEEAKQKMKLVDEVRMKQSAMEYERRRKIIEARERNENEKQALAKAQAQQQQAEATVKEASRLREIKALEAKVAQLFVPPSKDPMQVEPGQTYSRVDDGRISVSLIFRETNQVDRDIDLSRVVQGHHSLETGSYSVESGNMVRIVWTNTPNHPNLYKRVRGGLQFTEIDMFFGLRR